MTSPQGFADDPVASHSAQFPLGAPLDRTSDDAPSAAGTRPWILRAMRTPRTLKSVPHEYTYRHATQTAVNDTGQPLAAQATANKVTNNDGDEGPSEDFTYDYAPDEPFPV